MDNQDELDVDKGSLDTQHSLEMPPDISPPEPMGGFTRGAQTKKEFVKSEAPQATSASQVPQPVDDTEVNPQPQEPKGSIVPFILMVIIGLILVAGILVFISWKGWISLGGIEKLWGGGKPTPTPTKTSSPLPSSASQSPQVTTNINDQTRKSDLANLQAVLKKYYADKSSYPVSKEVTKTSDAGSALAQSLVPKYLEKLPEDPMAPQYYYGYVSSGKTFELTTVLEDKTDPEGIKQGNYFIYKVTN